MKPKKSDINAKFSFTKIFVTAKLETLVLVIYLLFRYGLILKLYNVRIIIYLFHLVESIKHLPKF